MTIRVLNSVSGKTNSGSAVVTLGTLGASVLVAAVSRYQSIGDQWLTDDQNNNWKELHRDGRTQGSVIWFVCNNPINSSALTITTGGYTSYPVLSVAALSGIHLGSLHDPGYQYNESSAGTGNPGSITPVQDNEIVLTAATWDKTGTASVSGYTGVYTAFVSSVNMGGGIFWNVQTTATATDPTWTWSQSMIHELSVVAFKSAAENALPVRTKTAGPSICNEDFAVKTKYPRINPSLSINKGLLRAYSLREPVFDGLHHDASTYGVRADSTTYPFLGHIRGAVDCGTGTATQRMATFDLPDITSATFAYRVKPNKVSWRAGGVGTTGGENRIYIGGNGDANGEIEFERVVTWVATTITAPTALTVDVWASVAGTLDKDGLMTLYIDGEPVGTATAAGTTANESGQFGNRANGATTTTVNGLLDYCYVWDRALTHSEVKQLHRNPDAPFRKPLFLNAPTEAASTSTTISVPVKSQRTNNGLVFHWKGSLTHEESRNHFALTPSASLVGTPHRGKVWSLNGSSEDVDCGNVLNFDTNDPYTVLAWVKPDSAPGTEAIIGNMRNNGNYDGWLFGFSGGKLELLHRSTLSDFIQVIATPTVSSTDWGQYACRYDGSGNATGLSLFDATGNEVANSEFGTSVSGTTANDVNLHLGSRNSASRWLGGNVGELRIYNRALSDAEIRSHYRPRHRKPLIINIPTPAAAAAQRWIRYSGFGSRR